MYNLGKFLESGLNKMLIKSERGLDFKSLHYDERNAIRERIVLVSMLLEVGPAFPE